MGNKDKYILFCEQNEVPLFAQPWWLDAVCKNWDAVTAEKDGVVTGTWAYPVERKYAASLIRQPLLTPYLGPLVHYPAGLKPYQADNLEWETTQELSKQLPNANYINLSLPPGFKQAGALRLAGYTLSARQTFLLDLTKSEKELIGGMRENLSRNIKKGTEELIIKEDPGALNTLFDFHLSTLASKNKGIAHTKADMQRLLNACLETRTGTLYTASSGAGTEAVVWYVYDKKCGYYLMGAQNSAGTSYRAISALLWHAIKRSREQGLQTFDLEGSMDPGVEQYYRTFGATRQLYLVMHRSRGLPFKWLHWRGW